MKKIIMLILLLLTMISVGYGTYQIQYTSYTGDNINLTGGSSYRGLTLNSNGSSFYYSETTTDRVYQYDCTTAYNVSSCTNSGKNLSVGALELNPFGIVFNSNGSSFYFTGSGADTIFQYSCTTAYDISTCTNSGKNLNVTAQDNAPTSLTFNNIGTSVFMLGTTNDRLFQYSCTTAYDISTCTYTSNNLNILSQDNSPFGVTFNNGGSSVLVLGNQNDNLNQYDCTTAYNLSTCSYNSSFYVGTQDLTAYGLTINSNGSSFYIVGDTNDKIFQYSIPFVNNPEITSIVMNDTALKIGDTSLLTIVFNGAVYNFTNADITTIDNGVLSPVTSSNNITWTSIFTPTNDIKDLTNVITITKTNINNIYNLNGIGTNSTANYQIDTQRPEITSIVMNDTALKIGDTSLLTIVFSEAVYNFTNADFTTIDNGNLTSVTSSDNITWTSIFTPNSGVTDATNIITLSKSNLEDSFGNAGSGSNSTANYQIDTQRPEITSLVMNDTFLINGETALLTIVFSEAVYNFTNADITTIDNGVLSPVTSSNNITWTSIFTPNSGVTNATNIIIINKTNINDYYGNTGIGINFTTNYEIYTINPSLNISLPSVYNYYTGFNFSRYINYSSSLGISSCIVSISGGNSTTCNNTNYNFTTNGNQTYNITAIDLAGNTVTESGVTLVNPYQTFRFYDYLRLTNINDFYIDGVLYSSNYTFKTYDYGLGSWDFDFSKEGYVNQTFNFSLNSTSNYNQTNNVTAVTITIKAYDINTLAQIPFNLTLSDGVIAQYYNQVNFTDYYNNTPQGDVNALIASTGYSDASYNINIGAYSALTLNAYLIPVNDSNLFQFTVLSQDTGAALANVLIEVQELINTSYITVSSKLTGDNGKTYFYLDSSKDYKVIFSKNEYVTATAFTIPTVTTYTVKLTGDSTTFNYVNEISYSFKPSEYLLQNNETYNFIGFISGNSLTSSNFSIVLNNGTTIYTNSNVNPTGTTYNYSYTIPPAANFTQMTMTINYIIDGELFTVSKDYKVITLNEDSFIKTMQNFGKSNTEESNLWKWFIVMIASALVLISGVFLGTAVPLLIIPLWVFFSFVGWVDFTFTAVISVVALIMFLGGRR